MAYLPVPSLQTGGALWFLDLTAADPFYILPLAVTGTMFFILEVGILLPNFRTTFMSLFFREIGMSKWTNYAKVINFGGWMSLLLVGCRVWCWQPQPASHENRVQDHAPYHPPHDHQLPYSQFAARSLHMSLLFALSMSKSLLYFLLSNTPQAVFTYWLTSNCFSLGQVALLRLPAVREKFNIPEKIKHPASALPQNDGFVQSIKKGGFLYAGWQNLIIQLFNVCCWSFCAGWKNAQLAQQLEERERRIKNHLELAAKGQSHRFICQLCQLNASFVHILLTKCLK